MRAIPAMAARQCGVFSAGQAATDGWTPAALRWATDTGRLTRLRRGVFQQADLDGLDPFTRRRWRHAAPAIAAVFAVPGALASHSAAAVLYGIPLLFVPLLPCVTVVPWHTGEIPGTHVHRTTCEPLALPVGHVVCTSVERTVIDMAREHGVASGVVALDHALHNRLTSEARVREALERCRRWPGVRAARAALNAADARSESPLESRSRLKLLASALPPPRLQTRIGDTASRFVARVDFYWDEFGVVGEVDGSTKYRENPQALIDEKWRQEQLERLGLITVRWGHADLAHFDGVIERLSGAFARGNRHRGADRRWTVLPSVSPSLPPGTTLTPWRL